MTYGTPPPSDDSHDHDHDHEHEHEHSQDHPETTPIPPAPPGSNDEPEPAAYEAPEAAPSGDTLPGPTPAAGSSGPAGYGAPPPPPPAAGSVSPPPPASSYGTPSAPSAPGAPSGGYAAPPSGGPPAAPPPTGGSFSGPSFTAPSADEAKGFLSKLFDLSFRSFVTPSVVKVLYLLAIVLAVIGWLSASISAFRSGAAYGLLVLIIIGPIVALFWLILLRVTLELYIAVIRIAEDIRTLVRR